MKFQKWKIKYAGIALPESGNCYFNIVYPISSNLILGEGIYSAVVSAGICNGNYCGQRYRSHQLSSGSPRALQGNYTPVLTFTGRYPDIIIQTLPGCIYHDGIKININMGFFENLYLISNFMIDIIIYFPLL